MNIVFRWFNLEKDEKIEERLRKKILSLARFAKKIFEKEILVQVEIGKTTGHKKGPFFYVECQIEFPKKILRAVAEKENLFSAIEEVESELSRQIKKYKEQILAKTKRRIRKIKRTKRIAKEAQTKEGKRVWFE